jgi:hypothetical protein
MKKFKNHQLPRRKYRFDIVGHKKALKIWWDNPFIDGPNCHLSWFPCFMVNIALHNGHNTIKYSCPIS